MAAVAFEADGAGGGDFEGGFEDFAVAGAVGDAVFDDDDHFVPEDEAARGPTQSRPVLRTAFLTVST